MMDVYLGLDLGTTGLKALLADENGRVRHSAARPLTLQSPRPAWAEQDPAEWLRAAEDLLASLPRRYQVRRIGLSGQMHSLIPLDAAGRVIRPAILWCDQRASAQSRAATRALGGEARAIKLTGNPVLEGFTLPKLLWLREKEPAHFKRMKSFLLPKDYLGFWLTGEKLTDPSDAAGSAAFDVVRGRWSRTVQEKLDLAPELFPAVIESHASRGALRKKLAARFGLAGAEVAGGGADNAASALGAGVLEPGRAAVSVGSSGTVLAAAADGRPDREGRLHLFNHAVPGLLYHMGVMLSAASALQFFAAKFSPRANWAQLTAEMEKVAPGAGGLLFLPYLSGERTPHRDPDARGVLAGLALGDDRARILRAVMEGVSFGLRDSFELLKKRTKIDSLTLVGGGAKNPLWRRILAANFQLPVVVPQVDAGGAYGAAMLAALGRGRPLDEVAAWVRPRLVEEPDSALAAAYDRWYPEFQGLYADLQARFKRLAALAAY